MCGWISLEIVMKLLQERLTSFIWEWFPVTYYPANIMGVCIPFVKLPVQISTQMTAYSHVLSVAFPVSTTENKFTPSHLPSLDADSSEGFQFSKCHSSELSKMENSFKAHLSASRGWGASKPFHNTHVFQFWPLLLLLFMSLSVCHWPWHPNHTQLVFFLFTIGCPYPGR